MFFMCNVFYGIDKCASANKRPMDRTKSTLCCDVIKNAQIPSGQVCPRVVNDLVSCKEQSWREGNSK